MQLYPTHQPICLIQFQSMHPIKDATKHNQSVVQQWGISIHAPYKGCNTDSTDSLAILSISIHAPYKGCNAWWADV